MYSRIKSCCGKIEKIIEILYNKCNIKATSKSKPGRRQLAAVSSKDQATLSQQYLLFGNKKIISVLFIRRKQFDLKSQLQKEAGRKQNFSKIHREFITLLLIFEQMEHYIIVKLDRPQKRLMKSNGNQNNILCDLSIQVVFIFIVQEIFILHMTSRLNYY